MPTSSADIPKPEQPSDGRCQLPPLKNNGFDLLHHIGRVLSAKNLSDPTLVYQFDWHDLAAGVSTEQLRIKYTASEVITSRGLVITLQSGEQFQVTVQPMEAPPATSRGNPGREGACSRSVAD